MSDTCKILFLAAEADPFIKIGGLADVAGSLPKALRNLIPSATDGIRLDVRLVLPLHRQIQINPDELIPILEFPLARDGSNTKVQVLETSLSGTSVYFINGEPISSSTRVYSQDPGQDREKFTFFSLAALEMIRYLEWQPDLIHANDWHTALAIYALRSHKGDLQLDHIRTILTLHNLPYMGGDATGTLFAYGLRPAEDEILPIWARTQPLPLGLLAADVIVPVSPGYAGEILTPDFGCGLDTFLSSRSDTITGILNGLDLSIWNPETDENLIERFNPELVSNRNANKAELQHQLGLKEESRIPLLAMIGRMDTQKGVDITIQTLHQMQDSAWQFVILGSGDPEFEILAKNLQAAIPDHVRAAIRFDTRLSHLIYGGADMLLMPSRYEPCGLAQMIAMHYGCVPVVHATGGLRDTVHEGKTGFLFQKAESTSMREALQRALSVFSVPEYWERIQRSGMQEDFSWSKSAAQYAALYHALIERGEK